MFVCSLSKVTCVVVSMAGGQKLLTTCFEGCIKILYSGIFVVIQSHFMNIYVHCNSQIFIVMGVVRAISIKTRKLHPMKISRYMVHVYRFRFALSESRTIQVVSA